MASIQLKDCWLLAKWLNKWLELSMPGPVCVSGPVFNSVLTAKGLLVDHLKLFLIQFLNGLSWEGVFLLELYDWSRVANFQKSLSLGDVLLLEWSNVANFKKNLIYNIYNNLFEKSFLRRYFVLLNCVQNQRYKCLKMFCVVNVWLWDEIYNSGSNYVSK